VKEREYAASELRAANEHRTRRIAIRANMINSEYAASELRAANEHRTRRIAIRANMMNSE